MYNGPKEKGGKAMAKRQTFYVRADLFERKLSPRAKLVLVYLSCVSNRQGVSFPSVSTVALCCGCCPNSARKALKELAAAGCLSITARTLPTRRGNRVHTSNIYTLLFVPSKNEAAPLQPVKGGTATDEGQRYNSKLTMDTPYGHSQSVYDRTDHDHDRDRQDQSVFAGRSRSIPRRGPPEPFAMAADPMKAGHAGQGSGATHAFCAGYG